MVDKLKFTVNDIKLVDNLDSSKFALLNIECFASGDNAHDITVTEEVLKKAEKTIFYIPVVWFYDVIFDDAGGHDKKEVPCGFVPKASKISYEILDDGRTMFIVEALVWKKYSGKLMSIFKREDGKKNVSVEISINDYSEKEDDGIEILDYSYDAITVLGEVYTPAILGANAKVMQFAKFAKDEKEEFGKAFKKEFLFSSKDYSGIDFSIPEEVKEKVYFGISLMEENEIDIEPVIIKYSSYLLDEKNISPKRAKYIYAHLDRYMKIIGESEEINSDYVSFMLLGGNGGMEFLFNIIEEMKYVDNKTMNYFNFYGKEESEKMKEKKELITEEILEEDFSEDEAVEEEVQEQEVFEEDEAEEDDDAHMADEEEEEEVEEDFEEEDIYFEEESEDDKTDFALNVRQKREVLRSVLSEVKDGDYSRYWLETFDDEYIYFYDYADNKTYRCKYIISEKNVATIDFKSQVSVVGGGYEVIGEEKEEDFNSVFSLDAYLDVPAMLEFLEKEVDDYSTISQDALISAQAGDIMKLMYDKMALGEALIETLSEFKASVEQDKLNFEVEQTLLEVKEYLTKEEIEEAREEAKDFTTETINSWKNAIIAKAFAQKKVGSKITKIKKHALPFQNVSDEINKNRLWK